MTEHLLLRWAAGLAISCVVAALLTLAVRIPHLQRRARHSPALRVGLMMALGLLVFALSMMVLLWWYTDFEEVHIRTHGMGAYHEYPEDSFQREIWRRMMRFSDGCFDPDLALCETVTRHLAFERERGYFALAMATMAVYALIPTLMMTALAFRWTRPQGKPKRDAFIPGGDA